MSHHNHTRVAGVAVLSFAALVAGPMAAAQAKSDVSITASPGHVRVGASVTLQATGGGDIARLAQVLCIQHQHSRTQWVDVACRRLPDQSSGTVSARIREQRAGRAAYRAYLSFPGSHGTWTGYASAPTTVTVTG